MTNEEIKNLLPPQMRIINTTAENGEALLRGETVMDSAGNETTMGFNDVVAVPDNTDERLEVLEKKVNEGSGKLYRHNISVRYKSGSSVQVIAHFVYTSKDGAGITLSALHDLLLNEKVQFTNGYVAIQSSNEWSFSPLVRVWATGDNADYGYPNYIYYGYSGETTGSDANGYLYPPTYGHSKNDTTNALITDKVTEI